MSVFDEDRKLVHRTRLEVIQEESGACWAFSSGQSFLTDPTTSETVKPNQPVDDHLGLRS